MEQHFILLYLLGFLILLVALFILYIKFKYKFWSLQPVFHFYDFYYWIYNKGIICTELPEKNKYTNLQAVKTYEFPQSLTSKQLQDFIVLVQLHYLCNKENKFLPKNDNIMPYFVGHFATPFFSLYTRPRTFIHSKSNTTFIQDEIVGVITSRPLHVQIQINHSKKSFNKMDVYYVDYLCVNKGCRKQQIAPQLIQTHEYNQSHLNKDICVSLFKREEELTGIIPLTYYKTYCYQLRQSHYTIPPLLSSSGMQVLTGDKQNLYYFYNFLKETESKWDILVYPEVANLIELIITGNIFLKMIIEDGEIISAYIFRKTCTYITKDKEVVSCFASIKSNNISINDFIIGFKHSLWSIIKDNQTFGYISIESVSDNYLLIEDKNKNNCPIVISPTAYFFYNFAYNPFESKKCLLIN